MEKHDHRDERKCFRWAKVGHIAKDSSEKDDKDESGGSQIDTAMVTIAQTALPITASRWQSNRWMLDLFCSKHMSNSKSYLWNFVKYEVVVQVGNNEVVCSYREGAVQLIILVNGMQHHITLREVM